MNPSLRDLLNRLPNRGTDEEGAENPFERGYVGWGPYEDYLCDSGERAGWRARVVSETWAGFLAEWRDLDPDLNLVIDFYFQIGHEAKDCESCDCSGLNPATKKIDDEFYSFADRSQRWCDRITQDEVQKLVDEHRLTDFTHGKPEGYAPTAEEVNAAQYGRRGYLGHDAINRWILVQQRAERLGVYGRCEQCQGSGSIRLGPDRLELNLWVAHPRKGATRGIHIKDVPTAALDEVRTWLRRSWDNHARHFRWVTTPASGSGTREEKP